MRKRSVMNALAPALGLLCAVTSSLAAEVATADGKIVSSIDALSLVVRAVPPPLTVRSYSITESSADPAPLPETTSVNGSKLIWGYEAAFTNSRLLSNDIGPPVTPGSPAFCVPDSAAGGPTGNGRGVAFDPIDGNLWISRLDTFSGDGFIHKIRPPNVSSSGVCAQVGVIPFGDGPGGTIQDDIGALDVDEQTRHIWAAGYKPITVEGETVKRSYLYLVNRNSGAILRSCWIPFDNQNEFGGNDFGVGNDTLIYARLDGLPGSGQYLLTDAGEESTNQQLLFVVDAADCKSGRQATIVATYPKTADMTGVDFEWPGLLTTDLKNLRDHDGPPFASFTDLGPWGNSTAIEDVSLCAFRARFGGGETDSCPY